MKKLFIVLTLICLLIASSLACSRCKGNFKGRYFPAYSKQFSEVLSFTEKRLNVRLSKEDRSYLQKIFYRENRKGDIQLRNRRSSAFGLPQGLRSTYRNVGVPYGIKCPSCQTEVGIKYILRRHKTFQRAYRHSRSRGWY